MSNFNLTAWALKHKQLMYFFIAVVFIGGLYAYQNLGRMEDPDFTIREMVITAVWPGATAKQMEEQISDKIEKKLQDIPGLDYIESDNTPGRTIIHVDLKDDVVSGSQVRPTWLDVRNMVNDIRDTLPQGVYGPYFNDRFDDVFGQVYALTGDGYSYEDLRAQAERIRRILLGVPSVKKVELIGVQAEKIYIEIPTVKLAELGLAPTDIISAVQGQSAMVPAGMIDTSTDNVYLRISGIFENLDDLRTLPIRAGGRTFRLGDIATIHRSYSEPSDPKMYFNGKPAVSLTVSMDKGGNILTLKQDMDKTITQIQRDLPLGLEINTVSDQPKIVKESINEFVESLVEAVLIVLIVCFLSLGMRCGSIVALCIPLVIAGVFAVMFCMGIDLQKISLGALIIALGLLVDDAIITIEMMLVKMEQGWSKFDAACFSFTSTAFPRLTGELVTCAGFIPVGFSKGAASEICGYIFIVVTIALLISWLVAGTVTPLLGYKLINITPACNVHDYDIYNTKFYRRFKEILVWCLKHRKQVLAATVACFIGAVALFGLIKQEFFPATTRPELIVDLRLPQGSSLKASDEMAQSFASRFADNANIASYAYYVGQGAPRFVLTATPIDPADNFVEFIFVAKDLETREKLTAEVNDLLSREFNHVRSNVRLIQNGPPAEYPVMLRISGYDHDSVRQVAEQARDILSTDPELTNINLNWDEKSKVMHLTIDQDKARMLGLNTQALSSGLQAMLSGVPVAEFRESDRTINIVFRVDAASRNDLSRIKDINLFTGNGKYIPLDQIATIRYDAEEGLIWRRDLKPTITLQANTASGVTGEDATYHAFDRLKDLRASLPVSYKMEVGGMTEKSIKATGWLLQPIPIMLLVIITLLMFQLQDISKMIITLLTAPLGLIGVSLGLFLTGRPLGFVAQLGILALAGIIMRNSVILIDQIDQQLAAGQSLWDAIINATVLRFRPIMLTAAAAILGMIPLVFSVFWGSMAVAIASGLFGATILTLLVLPTIYAAWYKVNPTTEVQVDENAQESRS